MEIVNIKHPDDLGDILDFVHDQIFNLSNIKFYKEEAKLAIRLSVDVDKKLEERKHFFLRTWKSPVVFADLIVKNVNDYEIIDQAQTGQGCINDILFDQDVVIITNCVPVEIKIKVSDFELELQISDDVIKTRKQFSFGK